MNVFEDLYFALFNEIDAVVNEFDGNPAYEPVISRLKQVELKAEDMYVNRP